MIKKGQTGSYGLMGEHRTQERPVRVIARRKDGSYVTGEVTGRGDWGSYFLKDAQIKTSEGTKQEKTYYLDYRDIDDDFTY